MAQATQKACKGCAGRGQVTNAARQTQLCPNCNGSGAQPQKVYRIPFDYVFPQVVLAANQPGNSVLQIQFDSDFEWIWIVGTRTGAFTIQLNDSSTGRNLSSSPVNDTNFMGTAQLPFPLVEPYLLARSTTVTAALLDLSGAVNTVQLVFRGYKLFPQDAPQQGSAGQVFQQQTNGTASGT
jgi:hypothetical protein